MLIISDAFFVAGALSLSLAQSIAALVAGRIITGVGFGLILVVAPVYLSEISPKAVRGRILAVCLILIVLGSISSYLFGYLLTKNWRLLFALAAVPAALQALLMTLLPESPRWLYKKGEVALTVTHLAKIYNANILVGRAEMEMELKLIRDSLE